MFLGGIKEKHWPEMGQEKNLAQISKCHFTIPSQIL